MVVIVEKSICVDCVWRDSCQKLERMKGDEKRGDEKRGDEKRGDEKRGDEKRGDEKRENPGRPKDIFEVIVLRCSLRNFDRSYKNDRGEKALYYCLECDMNHRSNSRIGILHKKEPT